MPNFFTKSLLVTTLISTAVVTQTQLHADKPELFNYLPQNTLFISHTTNAKKEIDMYKKSQLYKELSEINYLKIIEQMQKAEGGTPIDTGQFKKILNEKNTKLLMALLDSAVSFAILRPEQQTANSEVTSDDLFLNILSNSILQIEPEDEDTVNELIKIFATQADKDYIRSKSDGYVINQFKIEDEQSFYILEKSGVFTLTMNSKQTIKLLSDELDKNMNNLSETAPLFEESHDSIAYANIREFQKVLATLDHSPELKMAFDSLNYFNEYLIWNDINLDDLSQSSTFTTKLGDNIPSYIKSLVKSSDKQSKTSGFFNKDTALFYNFTGLKLNEIAEYFAQQNGLTMQDLTSTDPKLGLIYNKLVLGLGQDYALNISDVKAGMIPIPLATLAIEVKSEKIIKELITDQLSEVVNNGGITKLTKTEKGTEITTLVTSLPGFIPAYMFYKGYLFISSDVTELIKILNTTDKDSLQNDENFQKVTKSDKVCYQTNYINGERLFGITANTLTGLLPLFAQTPSDQLLYTKFIIPILKSLKNLEAIGVTSEATSTKELTQKNRIYIK